MSNLLELDKLLKNGRGLPKEFRFYYIVNGRHFYANNGIVQEGFGKFDTTDIERDSLLTIYGRMEFIFDELIRLLLMSFFHDEKSRKLLYILSIVPVNRKIRLFLDWKIFGKEFTQRLSRLFEVRNDAVHSVNLEEIKYRKNKSLSLAKKNELRQFKDDLQSACDELITIYNKQIQKMPLSRAIQEIKEFQAK